MSLLDQVIQRCSDVSSMAEGGQKKVLAAVHPDFGSVVIKHGEYHHATKLERITREVELLRELDSQYYPKQYEFLVEPVRREFLIIEERLDAVELADASDRFSDDASILALLRQLVCALDVIWRRNVVHRDLKPANILVTEADEPRIIDLGIARFLDEVSLTHSLAFHGPATPIYAAPEQLMNRKAMINHRTDFFVLGVVILELMHGFHPFDPRRVGNDQTLIDNVLSGDFLPPEPSRDGRLVGFVNGVLNPKPFKRFRTVDALMAHLEMERGTC